MKDEGEKRRDQAEVTGRQFFFTTCSVCTIRHFACLLVDCCFVHLTAGSTTPF